MTRAFYLDAGAEPIFAMLDEPPASAAPSAAAVLLCPPVGWQDVSSYRPRRDWARELAAAGHPTLRIDLPGSGDSGGDPRDPGRFDAWVSAISAAVAWLREACGRPRLAAVGIALGAAALYGAVADGAPVDELVLWGASGRGRALVREQRAFARLERSQQPSGEPPAVPEGALMTAGYLLNAETVSELERFDVEQLPPPSQVSRALLLERDGIAVDERLRHALASAGAEVTTAPGDGFADMLMAEPQDAKPARAVLSTVGAWIAAGDGQAENTAATRPAGAAAPEETSGRPPIVHLEAELTAPDGGMIRETPLYFESPSGRLFGILAEPQGVRRDLCLVLLNAGAQRRIGVNRMWVELARRWADRGVPSLRLDLEAIGDSDGESERFTDLASFYVPEFVGSIPGVLDALQRRGLPPRFVMLGLCSGAYWSLHAALADRRVSAALMLNTRVLAWDPNLLSRRDSEQLRRSAVSTGAWRRILSGETSRGRLSAGALVFARSWSAVSARAFAAVRGRISGDEAEDADDVERLLDALRDRGQRGLLLFTAGEPVYEELKREGHLARLHRWPNLTIAADERLRSGTREDHTLRPLWLQRHVHALLDATLEAELESVQPAVAARTRSSPT